MSSRKIVCQVCARLELSSKHTIWRIDVKDDRVFNVFSVKSRVITLQD